MSYIFFYENYDIFKTEQLCANLYKLMEMILIAKHIKKTLVLPNFYFTPRNNELIYKNNKLEIDRIELIDIRNIIDINKLSETCNFISINDYFMINKQIDKIKTILVSKPNDDLPFNNNKYHTIYGTINVNDKLDIDYSSINILNHITKFQDYDNIIIHNYNRMGNPLWYKSNHDNYKIIRNSLKFNSFFYEKISNVELDFQNTLLVHWRRGDFLLSQGDEEETREYYKRYNQLNQIENISKNIILRCLENNINNVFLLTNETDENEINKLSSVLNGFNINLNTYSNSIDNNYLKYLINDVCGIMIGSKCKYQLHGFGSYDRMSQFGRWIIEENLENKLYFVE